MSSVVLPCSDAGFAQVGIRLGMVRASAKSMVSGKWLAAIGSVTVVHERRSRAYGPNSVNPERVVHVLS
jgi:hypothetical protein